MQSFLAAPTPLPTTLADAHARIEALEAALAGQPPHVRILDQNPNPIFRLGADGEVLYQNPAGERARATLGVAVADELRAAVRVWARTALSTGTVGREEASTGGRHFAACIVPDRAARCVTLYLTDVTELKAAQEAAEAAAQARANFLANMSHEIRTPLNGVLGIAAQLAKTPLDARQRELLQIVQASGGHLLRVINDVLDMAKISSGKLELAHEPFDVCEMLYQAAQPLFVQAQEKGIEVEAIRLHESCPNPRVMGDAHRLSQIILNLFSNAIKFTPAGGRIKAGGYQVAETAEALTVEFRFSDTGVGIPASKLASIFDSFTQAYADTARQFGGTGLGLSISRALVEQMGGTLTVESTEGKGSTFTFRLTLPRAAAVESAFAAPDNTPNVLRGKRVLLVEDNEVNRLVARMLLEDWGVTLDEAEDGSEGVAQAAATPYDVILMDIQLPGMSGLDAAAHIRALPDAARAGVPIVALTANAFESDTQQYLAGGMQACVAKPFDEQQLYQALCQVLQHSA